ncbi:MAG: SAM-dependent methyltransferase, partial [Propionibacteriaceae bacterium]|nr:SAM-dependent methyltransferase [Propionibacteriaceae bacterium]
DAVIGLAPNLFYGTGLAACVLVLRTSKPEGKRGKVLFINAESLFKRGRNQNTLEPEHAAQILDAFHQHTDIAGLSHVATLDEIAAQNGNLNIPLYVAPAASGEQVTLQQALADLEAAHATAQRTRANLEAELAKWRL